MKTSLFETEQIEKYLLKKMPQEESLVFEARLLLDPNLKNNISAQLSAYSIIDKFGRKSLRAEIVGVQNQFLNDPLNLTVREKLKRIFKK